MHKVALTMYVFIVLFSCLPTAMHVTLWKILDLHIGSMYQWSNFSKENRSLGFFFFFFWGGGSWQAYMGVWGFAPSEAQGQSVGESGGKSPPDAEGILI